MAEILLSDPQAEVMESDARFRVICAGRRFGKTFLAIAFLLFMAVAMRGATCWYIAPTYRQAKQIAWKMLKRMTPSGWAVSWNETDLTVILCNGSEISLRGADNPDSLRGVSLWAVVLDEYADMDASVWPEVIRPALADLMGSALFIGTPKGFNHFHTLWAAAHTLPGWAAWSFTTADGGNVAPEEIESARAELDERTFRQEFLASFETLAGRVYQNFERQVHVTEVNDAPSQPLLVGMDFNINPMSAVLATIQGGQLHVFGEIEIPNGNTELMAAEIRRRYPKRPVRVYPDPSGNARKTSAPVGQTDFAILKAAGFQVIAPAQAPLVVDRVNEVNAIFRNADGAVRAFISPRAKTLIRCLEGLTWKEGTSAPDKSLGLDHMPDAFGYLVHSEFPIIRKTAAFHAINF
mgnify:CR=1 FL=1